MPRIPAYREKIRTLVARGRVREPKARRNALTHAIALRRWLARVKPSMQIFVKRSRVRRLTRPPVAEPRA
jgi:hypothetical protein